MSPFLLYTDPTGYVPENYCPLLCPSPTSYSTYSKIPGLESVLVDWNRDTDLNRFDLNTLLVSGQVSSAQYSVLSPLYLQQSGLLWIQGIDPFLGPGRNGGNRLAEFRALEAVFNPPPTPPSSPPSTPPAARPVEVSTMQVVFTVNESPQGLQADQRSLTPWEVRQSVNITTLRSQLSISSTRERPDISPVFPGGLGVEYQVAFIDSQGPKPKEFAVGPVSVFYSMNGWIPTYRGVGFSVGPQIDLGFNFSGAGVPAP